MLQNILSYQSLAKHDIATTGEQATITLTPQLTSIPNECPSFTSSVSISRISQETESARKDTLIAIGKLLAITLANTLEQLKSYNQEAIYPIVSMLEPYMETKRELSVRMPPKSSTEVIVNITRKGKAKPPASLD